MSELTDVDIAELEEAVDADYDTLASCLIRAIAEIRRRRAELTWQVTDKRIDAINIAADELDDAIPSASASLRAMVAEVES